MLLYELKLLALRLNPSDNPAGWQTGRREPELAPGSRITHLLAIEKITWDEPSGKDKHPVDLQ